MNVTFVPNPIHGSQPPTSEKSAQKIRFGTTAPKTPPSKTWNLRHMFGFMTLLASSLGLWSGCRDMMTYELNQREMSPIQGLLYYSARREPQAIVPLESPYPESPYTDLLVATHRFRRNALLDYASRHPEDADKTNTFFGSAFPTIDSYNTPFFQNFGGPYTYDINAWHWHTGVINYLQNKLPDMDLATLQSQGPALYADYRKIAPAHLKTTAEDFQFFVDAIVFHQKHLQQKPFPKETRPLLENYVNEVMVPHAQRMQCSAEEIETLRRATQAYLDKMDATRIAKPMITLTLPVFLMFVGLAFMAQNPFGKPHKNPQEPVAS